MDEICVTQRYVKISTQVWIIETTIKIVVVTLCKALLLLLVSWHLDTAWVSAQAARWGFGSLRNELGS